MSNLSKRSTVYLETDIYKALKIKSVETSRSMSELVNEAVKFALAEDSEDLQAFEDRKNEPLISYEQMLKELKSEGKI